MRTIKQCIEAAKRRTEATQEDELAEIREAHKKLKEAMKAMDTAASAFYAKPWDEKIVKTYLAAHKAANEAWDAQAERVSKFTGDPDKLPSKPYSLW